MEVVVQSGVGAIHISVWPTLIRPRQPVSVSKPSKPLQYVSRAIVADHLRDGSTLEGERRLEGPPAEGQPR